MEGFVNWLFLVFHVHQYDVLEKKRIERYNGTINDPKALPHSIEYVYVTKCKHCGKIVSKVISQ